MSSQVNRDSTTEATNTTTRHRRHSRHSTSAPSKVTLQTIASSAIDFLRKRKLRLQESLADLESTLDQKFTKTQSHSYGADRGVSSSFRRTKGTRKRRGVYDGTLSKGESWAKRSESKEVTSYDSPAESASAAKLRRTRFRSHSEKQENTTKPAVEHHRVLHIHNNPDPVVGYPKSILRLMASFIMFFEAYGRGTWAPWWDKRDSYLMKCTKDFCATFHAGIRRPRRDWEKRAAEHAVLGAGQRRPPVIPGRYTAKDDWKFRKWFGDEVKRQADLVLTRQNLTFHQERAELMKEKLRKMES